MTSYEYQWQNSQAVYAHSFYAPVLLSMLPSPISQSEQTLKVLDLACGNGSLTNLIANQGFEVTGIEESTSGVEIATKNFPNCRFLQQSLHSPSPLNF